MEALSPRDVNAQMRPKNPPQKSKLAPAPSLKRAKDHPPPPPDEVHEPPSAGRPEGAKYHMGKLLGKGGFAICHEGHLSKSQDVFAMKIVKSHMAQKKMEQKFQTELQIHSKMKHPNIVEFVRAFSFQESTYIVLELCPNGSLMDMAKKRKYLTEAEVRYYTVQIAGGIKYMHAKGIIHRDLKMGNIFLDKDMNCKIGDFGLAALLMSGKDMTAIRRTTLCGTPNYIAPEILEKGSQGHDHMVDIWSLGIIVFAMLTGQPPFASTKQEDIYRKAKNLEYVWPEREDRGDPVSDEVKDLVAGLLQKAEDRPDPDMIVQHPFFSCGYFPSSDDFSEALRQVAPKFPSIGLRGSKAKVHLKNLRDACIKCDVGPDAPLKTGKIISTWKECAAEERAGRTPVVPLAEGLVYLPFVQWQRDPSEISLSFVKNEPVSKKTAGAGSVPLIMAAPKSFAALQRAQNQGLGSSSSVASKVANKIRSIREEPGPKVRQTSASMNVPIGAGPKIRQTSASMTVPIEAGPKVRQASAAMDVPVEPGRGLSALPLRKSSSRVRSAPSKNEGPVRPTNKVHETASTVKERLASDLVKNLGGPTVSKKKNVSHFNPAEPMELIPGTEPDHILENIKSFRAELLRALASKAPIAHQRAAPTRPTVVVKWVDYTNKFGLGYILSNGSVGCIFKSMKASYCNDPEGTTPPSCVVVRDAERHLQNRSNESYTDRHELVPMAGAKIEFYEKLAEGLYRVKIPPHEYKTAGPGPKGEVGRLASGKDRYDNRRREKLVLWKKFANYMITNGRDQENAILAGPPDPAKLVEAEPHDASNVMILYQRFGDVGCWAFGDGHFQFNFPDHTKLVISGDGTWCDFYHLPMEAAEEFVRTGNLPSNALDERQHLSYPIQTLLHFAGRPARSRISARGRPPPVKALDIEPSLQGIPEANQFRQKIEFIVQIVAEWIDNGGIGNSAMDTRHRLRWTGARQKVGVEPYKHVWVSVGATRGDERHQALFDPYHPEDCVEDLPT